MVNSTRAVLFFVLFASVQAFALSGTLIDVKDIIPQVCRVIFNSGEMCSGEIIGKKVISLADHCGMLMVKKQEHSRSLGKIRCYGEKEEFEISEVKQISAEFITKITGEHFKNSILPRAGELEPIENARFDIAAAVIEGEFKAKPLPIAKTSQFNAIQAALATPGACHIYGVGTNSFGIAGYGRAHGVEAPLFRAIAGPTNPLILKGETGVAANDSGGPLTCNVDGENVLVGIVSGGNGVVYSPDSEATKYNVVVSYFAFVGDPAVNAWLTTLISDESQPKQAAN
jgi:uncharacterized protein (DUF2164 family)